MKVHIKIGDNIFDVEIADINTRPIIAKVDGETFEVWPESESQSEATQATAETKKPALAPAELKAPISTPASAAHLSGKVMVAPLPGTVVEVFVKPGEYVETGNVLLVIEAMKMKNSIRATRSGTVAAVMVNIGQTVAHKQPLVEFSE